ncbi:hypothetical protein BDF19DRAFT_326927 [Syncephalis fuscata]|nr:hypothetical protein BDF19DRAFT_326927 [Syncephalis fuscata]
MPTELASSNTDLSLNVNQEKAPLNRYGNSMTETIPAITSINIKDINSNTGKLIASTTKGATANQSNAAMESKTEVPAISNETALITPSISSNSTTSSIPSSVKSMHNKTTEKDKSNSTSSSDDNNATSSNALPNIIMSHDLFSIVLERAATRKNPSAPASRRQSGHFSSSASSVRSVRWSTDVAPASAHKLTRQNSWSAADAHKLRQSNKTTAIEGSLSKEAPATYNNGAVKRGSVIPAAAAASASSPTSPIRGILMAPAPGSRRPSLTNATNQLSRNNSPRPSISHARPQSLYAVPHVTDDAQAKFLKVTDGLTFRYHPSQPLGGPGHFGRVYLGVNMMIHPIW